MKTQYHKNTDPQPSLNNYDICGFVDERSEKTGKKIRDSEQKKIPYMIIVGEKEESTNTVSVRKHGEGDLGSFTMEDFAELIKKEINNIKEEA